ncbi:MAG TPA: hypothetical protein VGL53_31110 [Bryobacteraceae bacterium]|jgi:hypothetical protein
MMWFSRPFLAVAALGAAAASVLSAGSAADKLTLEDRIEISRGLTAEYATARIVLPKSKKPLVFNSDGTYDKSVWQDDNRQFGLAARVGDLVQVTKITIEADKILFEINHGNKGNGHWYDHVEVGMGGATNPVGQGDSNAPSGTNIALHFGKSVPPLKAAEIKKMLAPVLDFDKHSATENYVEALPPEIKLAIEQKKAVENMDRDQVMLALGRPRSKTRETKDGYDQEDWIYGEPPGKITFVTFRGNKVYKVRDDYAGLGGSTAPKINPQ